MLIITIVNFNIIFLFKYPRGLLSVCSVCLFAVCLHLSCPL